MKINENLSGSWRRDGFKQLHKTKLGNGKYATDLDFCLVDVIRSPSQDAWIVVAFLDYKSPLDEIKMTEIAVYNQLIKIAPLFIIEGETVEKGPFTIKEYTGGIIYPYSHTPAEEAFLVFTECVENWSEFRDWENALRENRKCRTQPKS